MNAGEKILGPKLFNSIVRPTFYNQFVGGETEIELKITAKNLDKAGIRLMVCPVQEEDVGESCQETSG
jgi:hydroxyproline oxidase